jgi:hypothetical protein
MCSVCEEFERRVRAGTLNDHGAVAQLVERLHGMEEVAGSTPVSSTHHDDEIGFMLGGLVAGEGSFFTKSRGFFRNGYPRRRFVFQLWMATRDRRLVEALHQYLGVGRVSIEARPRRDHWQPMCSVIIASHRAHHLATIPFAERFLLPSAKRQQFEDWRDRLYAYEAHAPRRERSICSIPGCTKFVRGRMLCRSHYYRATGY